MDGPYLRFTNYVKMERIVLSLNTIHNDFWLFKPMQLRQLAKIDNSAALKQEIVLMP